MYRKSPLSSFKIGALIMNIDVQFMNIKLPAFCVHATVQHNIMYSLFIAFLEVLHLLPMPECKHKYTK